MACRPLAPSHCLHECCIIVNWTLRNKLQWNLNLNTKLFFHENAFENVVSEITAMLSRGWRVNCIGALPLWQTCFFTRSSLAWQYSIIKHWTSLLLLSQDAVYPTEVSMVSIWYHGHHHRHRHCQRHRHHLSRCRRCRHRGLPPPKLASILRYYKIYGYCASNLFVYKLLSLLRVLWQLINWASLNT